MTMPPPPPPRSKPKIDYRIVDLGLKPFNQEKPIETWDAFVKIQHATGNEETIRLTELIQRIAEQGQR